MTEKQYNCDICPISSVISPFKIATYHFGSEMTQNILGKTYITGDIVHLCDHHAHILYKLVYKENNDYLKWYI